MSDQHHQLGADSSSAHIESLEHVNIDKMMEAKAAAEYALARVTAERDGLLELVHDGVWMIDADGATVKTNPRLRELLGTTATQLRGLSLPDFVAPSRRAETRELLDAMLHGDVATTSLQLRRDDGELIWVDVRAERYDSGVTLAMSDQTNVRVAEDELRVMSSDLAYERALLDAVGEALIAVTADGRIAYFNPAAEELSGWTFEEVVGQPLERLAPDHVDPERIAIALEAISRGPAFHGEVDAWTRHASHVPMSITVAPLHGDDGTLVGMVAVAADLSERQHVEEQLRQAQKLEAIGRLASGVAHDFNNLLTAIHVSADILRASVSDPELREMADDVLTASMRGAELTKQLLAFGRDEPRAIAVLRLADVVEDLLAMLQRLLPESIEMVTALREDSGYIEADPTQVAQLLMNLVVNARDAMPHGGRLHVGVQTNATALGNYVTLVVRDNGVGMDEHTLDRIFEPFFTTKGEHGTGLGLATVFGIVQQNNGVIRVGSKVGEGSTFTIDFPQVRGISVADEVVSLEELSSTERARRILICEDQAPIRRLVAMVLRHRGYDVFEAATAEAALTIAGEHRRLDLLISDVILPQMDGPQLVESLREHHPDLRVLMMSGYASLESAGVGRVAGATFIQKPFRPNVLADRVRDLFDES